MEKQVHAFFSGTVQGVGFRFTAQRLAKQLRVCGYVKNLPDGRVEMLAEGSEGGLKDLLAAIQDSSVGPYIRDVEVDWGSAKRSYSTFSITG